MTIFPLFVMANDGPVSPVLVHLLSIMREFPFASHGVVKEPVPVEPGGQSCGGSGAAEAEGAALAEGAGAETDGAALAEAAAPAELSSLEQPTRASITPVVRS